MVELLDANPERIIARLKDGSFAFLSDTAIDLKMRTEKGKTENKHFDFRDMLKLNDAIREYMNALNMARDKGMARIEEWSRHIGNIVASLHVKDKDKPSKEKQVDKKPPAFYY